MLNVRAALFFGSLVAQLAFARQPIDDVQRRNLQQQYQQQYQQPQQQYVQNGAGYEQPTMQQPMMQQGAAMGMQPGVDMGTQQVGPQQTYLTAPEGGPLQTNLNMGMKTEAKAAAMQTLAGTLVAENDPYLTCQGQLCLYITPGTALGFTPPGAPMGVGGAMPNVPPKGYMNMFIPALPAGEVDVLRNAWEASTLVMTELSGLDLSPQLARVDQVTGSSIPTCESPVHPDPCPPGVRDREGELPLLNLGLLSLSMKEGTLTTLDPRNAEMMLRSDLIVKMIRNPVDQYAALFRMENSMYLQTRNPADIKWKVTFPDFMDEIWVKHVSMPTEKAQYVIRAEDLYMHPEETMKEFLLTTGAAKAAELSLKQAGKAALQVVQFTIAQGANPQIGSDFALVTGDAQIPLYPEAFQGKMLTGEVEGVLAQVIKSLMQHQEVLLSLGYVHYSPTLTGQPLNLLHLREQQQAHRSQSREHSYQIAGVEPGAPDPNYSPVGVARAQQKFAAHALEENFIIVGAMLGVTFLSAIGHCMIKRQAQIHSEWLDKMARAKQRLTKMSTR